MEKVVLLVEHSGEHLRCLLNPEQLEIKRQVGVSPRRSLTGAMAGSELTDDPLLYQGGGRTELTLDLLFDIGLTGQTGERMTDVRELTRPIWELSENQSASGRYGRPPTLRVLWGTVLNLRGLVGSVAERLEHFDADGRAARAWLRLKIHRLDSESPAESSTSTEPPIAMDKAQRRLAQTPTQMQEVVAGSSGERVDQVAADHAGHPAFWSLIAELNGLDDPLAEGNHMVEVPVRPVTSSPGGSE
ncbi:hypothetical protein [Marinimicrobium locisalis]|uniref:CIS tube protein n=1 Tax=Marinimicrobium locisalis TaxID=546022 RepID=UPI0032217DB7